MLPLVTSPGKSFICSFSLGYLATKHFREIQALDNQTHFDPGERIHAFRTSLKRNRAFWRLISHLIPSTTFKREKKRLQTASRRLSAGRNETAALRMMEMIATEARGGKYEVSTSRVLTDMRKYVGQSKAFEKALRALAPARSALKDSLSRFLKAFPKSGEWCEFEPGLIKAYRKARNAGKLSKGSASGEFHHWRKRVKDLWYQLTALQSLWPHLSLKKLLRNLDDLQERLGDENDRVLLSAMIQKAPARFGGVKAVKEVAVLLDFRVAEERKKILKLGGKIFRRRLFHIPRPREPFVLHVDKKHRTHNGREKAPNGNKIHVVKPP